jgi:hypothetical protein
MRQRSRAASLHARRERNHRVERLGDRAGEQLLRAPASPGGAAAWLQVRWAAERLAHVACTCLAKRALASCAAVQARGRHILMLSAVESCISQGDSRFHKMRASNLRCRSLAFGLPTGAEPTIASKKDNAPATSRQGSDDRVRHSVRFSCACNALPKTCALPGARQLSPAALARRRTGASRWASPKSTPRAALLASVTTVRRFR